MKALACVLLCLGLASLLLADDGTSASSPIKKFRLPQFNDAGFRTGLLVGDEARMISSTQIDIAEMHFTLFSGDEKNTVETTMLAPTATILIPDTKHVVVEGKGPVRVVREDLDASGVDWTYIHAERRLFMRQHVHVVFKSESIDLLK